MHFTANILLLHWYLDSEPFKVYALVFFLSFCNYRKQKLCSYLDKEWVLFGLHGVVIVRFYCLLWGKGVKTMGERADSYAACTPDIVLW